MINWFTYATSLNSCNDPAVALDHFKRWLKKEVKKDHLLVGSKMALLAFTFNLF